MTKESCTKAPESWGVFSGMDRSEIEDLPYGAFKEKYREVMSNRWIALNDACELLEISKSKFYRLGLHHSLPRFYKGRRVFYLRDGVLSFHSYQEHLGE